MAKDFVQLFAETLEMDVADVARDSEIRTLEKWDSVGALGILAMVEDQYGVQLSSEDYASVTTVGDLEKLVTGRARR